MEVELTLQDVEHLESKMEDLVGWMTTNMSSFPAIAFAVTVLGNAIEDAKTQLTDLAENEESDEDYATDSTDECECAVCDCIEEEM